MNPPLAFDDALTELKTLTSQTTNFTFTDDEMTQALQEAWNNSYVCKKVVDTSTSFQAGTYTYSIPTGMDVVVGIWYQPSSTDPIQQLDRRLYMIQDGNIYFIDDVARWLNDTLTLTIIGRKKLTTTDTLDADNLVNYVISLAAYLLLKRLSYKMTFQFLRNDTSMGDIINARRDMQADVLTYKQALQREFEAI